MDIINISILVNGIETHFTILDTISCTISKQNFDKII